MIDGSEILHVSFKNRSFVTAKTINDTHVKVQTYKKHRNSFTMFSPVL